MDFSTMHCSICTELTSALHYIQRKAQLAGSLYKFNFITLSIEKGFNLNDTPFHIVHVFAQVRPLLNKIYVIDTISE